MRKYNFDKFKMENLKKAILLRAEIFGNNSKRRKRNVRDKEEWSVFFILTEARKKKMEKKGELIEKNKRTYKLKI
ncbi:MAG TPA: hypothetical protein PLW95_02745 [bacterium]|nr:hypothetical protein [bacterium]